MRKITSNDGAPIARYASGSGPALLLIHGSLSEHTRWQPILSLLSQKFTVYTMDRRGRCESGDRPDYAIQCEFDDIAAVARSIAGPINLVAHSYGAVCALEAALQLEQLHKLVLYEPPIQIGIRFQPPGVIDHIQAALDAGDREQAVSLFATEVLRMKPGDLERFRTLPAWQRSISTVHTLPREMIAVEAYQFEPARFNDFSVPTLLLLGEQSPPFFARVIEALSAVLPDSRVVVLPGQQHAAMDTAPQLFVAEVVGFLSSP
jgi:pimeloyl-ACP methyl ester carboxylesterase